MVLDTGHRLPITTVCVSASSNPYLCSCSDDKVILWSLEDFSSNCSSSSKNGLLVGVDLGCISDCSISCDNSWLALCRECDMWIVQLQVRNSCQISPKIFQRKNSLLKNILLLFQAYWWSFKCCLTSCHHWNSWWDPVILLFFPKGAKPPCHCRRLQCI